MNEEDFYAVEEIFKRKTKRQNSKEFDHNRIAEATNRCLAVWSELDLSGPEIFGLICSQAIHLLASDGRTKTSDLKRFSRDILGVLRTIRVHYNKGGSSAN